jgi:hypothetical protein
MVLVFLSPARRKRDLGAAAAGAGLAFHSQQRVPCGLHGLDLFEKKFKSIELMVDERF